jgi:hypothetical protein
MINNIYILINLETNKKIPINEIIGPKRVTTVKNKVGGYGDASHQKGALEEDLVYQPNPEKGVFSAESQIGKYFIKNDLILKVGDEFTLKSPTGKTIKYKILDKKTI